MPDERRLRSRTPESRAFAQRVQVVMALTSRLNALPFADAEARDALLGEILGRPLPAGVTIHPPFYTDHGLAIELGERVFVNQDCLFSDLGGIRIGDDALIGPRVTLTTSGHPVDPSERRDGVTASPIVIEERVWLGACVTVCPGVTIGHDAVVGAGTVVAQDVPPLTVVTGAGFVARRTLQPQSLEP